jgi:hypothetical protein
MTSNTLSRRYEHMMHQTVDVKDCNEQQFLHHDNTPSHTLHVVKAIPHREKHSCHHPTTELSRSHSE